MALAVTGSEQGVQPVYLSTERGNGLGLGPDGEKLLTQDGETLVRELNLVYQESDEAVVVSFHRAAVSIHGILVIGRVARMALVDTEFLIWRGRGEFILRQTRAQQMYPLVASHAENCPGGFGDKLCAVRARVALGSFRGRGGVRGFLSLPERVTG